MTRHTIPLLGALALTALACGSDDDTATPETAEAAAPEAAPPEADAPTPEEPTTETAESSAAADTATSDTTPAAQTAAPDATVSTFQIDVWADNWMAVYVDGVLIGEDSVPITTERSFNAETFTFDAALPFTVAIEAKDFKETDSGIEYIGQQNQQMGDGGLIAQITDLTTGEVVAATTGEWSTLVIHQAPLNTDCERDPDPDATCEFLAIDAPDGWTMAGFDDSAWTSATVWSAADVSPKDGYDEIAWDPTAQLVWGTDLEIDNTVLLRSTVS